VEGQMIATGRYTVISREETDKLLQTNQIQVNSISSAANIRKLRLQKIDYIVAGSLDAIDNDYAVTVKMLDVSSGIFSAGANEFMGNGSRDLYNGINSLAERLAANAALGDRTAAQRAQSGGNNTVGTGTINRNTAIINNSNVNSGGDTEYKIGDRGPGGGLVFSVGEDQYMECSMALVKYSWSSAANAVKNFKGGGFSDWKLPSKEELDLIYQNLRKNNLGNLGDNWHWSSSEFSNFHAWAQKFSSGLQGSHDRSYTYSVRAVRVFSKNS
jgi:hypothetical protein